MSVAKNSATKGRGSIWVNLNLVNSIIGQKGERKIDPNFVHIANEDNHVKHDTGKFLFNLNISLPKVNE
uniref:Uncharacterized protein n=1 Tax=Rhizophora mucronata TaxID=61149 RepID=A0A2P2Q3R7_RHIMU